MTLDNLLEEIKYGKEFIESKKGVEGIQSFINEETNSLMISARADKLLRECDNSKTYVKKIARAIRNYKDYEDKLFEDQPVSSIYARMKIESIVEDINSAIIELENKKTLRESNQQNLGKTIAVLKHGVKKISMNKNIPLKAIKDAPGLIESYIKKETALIEKII